MKWIKPIFGRKSSALVPSTQSTCLMIAPLSPLDLFPNANFLVRTCPNPPIQNCDPSALLFHPHTLFSSQHLSPCVSYLYLFISCLIPHKLHESRNLYLVFIPPVPRRVSIERMPRKSSQRGMSRGRHINCDR